MEWKSYDNSRIRVQSDLSSYATKSNLKLATGTNTSKFPKKVDLANLKSNVHD